MQRRLLPQPFLERPTNESQPFLRGRVGAVDQYDDVVFAVSIYPFARGDVISLARRQIRPHHAAHVFLPAGGSYVSYREVRHRDRNERDEDGGRDQTFEPPLAFFFLHLRVEPQRDKGQCAAERDRDEVGGEQQQRAPYELVIAEADADP